MTQDEETIIEALEQASIIRKTGLFERTTPNMSLRDWFAGQALANPDICRRDDEYPQRTAYCFADAMLEARAAKKVISHKYDILHYKRSILRFLNELDTDLTIGELLDVLNEYNAPGENE